MEADFGSFLRWEGIRESVLRKLSAYRGFEGPVTLPEWEELRSWISDLKPEERRVFAHLARGTVPGHDHLSTGEAVLDDLCGELVGALEEAVSDSVPSSENLLAILDVTEGLVILSEHCKRRFSMETHWFELVLGLIEHEDAAVVTSVSDLLQVVITDSSSASRLFESLGGLAIVAGQVKVSARRRDVRHKFLQLLHFYLLPEPESNGRRQVAEKIALLSAHMDSRVVAGLQGAFELGASQNRGRTTTGSEDEEVDPVQGLAKRLNADTLISRRRSRGPLDM